MSPSGRLPVLVLPTGEVLVDEMIGNYAKDHNSDKLGELINQEHQADSQAFITLADTKLRHALAKDAAIKEMLTRRTILNQEEIYQEAADALKALSVVLTDNTYFFGE
ncbi:11733_t:CDS:2, partial [Acaulospora colombiana]